MEDRETFIGEGDEAAIKSGVPEGGEEQAVVGVKALGVAGAGGPRDDVAGSEQGGFGDAGQGAGVVPDLQQAGAEDVLAYPLDDGSFGLGCAGQRIGEGLESL